MRNSVLLAAAYLATRLPFVYRDGFPDGDQQDIALGILHGSLSGTLLSSADRLYGFLFSYAYYAYFFLFHSWFQRDPWSVFAVINFTGVAAGLVTLLAIHDFARTHWGDAIATCAAVLWMFVPGWWELTTFGHPSTLALGGVWVALAALARSERAGDARRVGWLVVATLAYAVALGLRADMALAAPALVASPLLASRSFPAVARAASSVALAVGLFVLGHRLVFAPLGVPLDWIWGHSEGVRGHSSPLVKKAAVWALGMGPVILLAAALGFADLVRRRRFGEILFFTAAAGPPLLYWLQIEGPFRHLLLPSAAVALCAGLALGRWTSARGAWARVAIAGGVVVANQLALAALYPAIVARYPWSYAAQPDERRWSTRAPMGDWFSNHRTAARSVRAEADEALWLATAAPDTMTAILVASYRAQFEFLARNPTTYRYEDPAKRGLGSDWAILTNGQRLFVCVGFDPQSMRVQLADARANGKLPQGPVYLSPAARPAGVTYPLDGLEIVTPAP